MKEAAALEHWFARQGRDLPWRRVHDPYHTLLVEFILQQTRIETGLRYYERFVKRFPTLASLASANENEVLQLWSGLGYYRRARNLHATAQAIMTHHQGRVPDDAAVLETLPGIGPYTAGAIASIAYDKPTPAIDGNQDRVIGRVLGIRDPSRPRARARVNAWASHLLQAGSPRILNQALMDVGSSVCTPRAPRCDACPLAPACKSRGRVRAPAPRAQRLVTESWDVLLHVRRGRLWLQEPRGHGLLGLLWLPPLRRSRKGSRTPDMVHSFSHRRWHLRFVRTARKPGGPGRWVTRDEMVGLPHGPVTSAAFAQAIRTQPAQTQAPVHQ